MPCENPYVQLCSHCRVKNNCAWCVLLGAVPMRLHEFNIEKQKGWRHFSTPGAVSWRRSMSWFYRETPNTKVYHFFSITNNSAHHTNIKFARIIAFSIIKAEFVDFLTKLLSILFHMINKKKKKRTMKSDKWNPIFISLPPIRV